MHSVHSFCARQYFVNEDDSVTEKIVVHKNSPRGTHFRRAGPRQKVCFESDEVLACIVTCGGLCPGVNTVIRKLVCGLHYMHGVSSVLGIENASPETGEPLTACTWQDHEINNIPRNHFLSGSVDCKFRVHKRGALPSTVLNETLLARENHKIL
ncbi:UNVERIFIED_CONTAM: ATP-dependent 6-phosphofructokinase [Sesamum angustifolium]|uniref:ATP-dependent 6-phosphofructokinase n=1 Tax=Sesamum angustifolium TaxID=2727405 RepID=A0AAW2LJW3_9LAMI